MSYTYLLEQGEESWAESFLDIPASVLSRLNLTAVKSCSNASETDACPSSRSGTMCEHLTQSRGVDSSMSCAEGSRVKTLALQGQGKESLENAAGCGQRWRESFAKLDHVSCSWKIRQLWLFEDLDESLATWPKWGWMQDGECWAAETPVGCTNAIESGFLHLPTIGKSETKGSSRKRYRNSPYFRGAKMSEGLRICEADPIYTHPRFAELMMGWIENWTRLQPLGMDKFQQWLDSHGKH